MSDSRRISDLRFLLAPNDNPPRAKANCRRPALPIVTFLGFFDSKEPQGSSALAGQRSIAGNCSPPPTARRGPRQPPARRIPTAAPGAEGAPSSSPFAARFSTCGPIS